MAAKTPPPTCTKLHQDVPSVAGTVAAVAAAVADQVPALFLFPAVPSDG